MNKNKQELTEAQRKELYKRFEDVKRTEGFKAAMEKVFGHVYTPWIRKHPKVERNDLCPCGSGKKYKKCCLFKK